MSAMQLGQQSMFLEHYHQTIGSIPCCECGIPIAPNNCNKCIKCLCTQVDITGDLQKLITIHRCPHCGRYKQSDELWLKADLGSMELLTFCREKLNLKKKKVWIVHTEFVYTEPHSGRIKVKLTVQREDDQHHVVLEQAYQVEYVVKSRMCPSCSSVQANPDQWVAVVQLRQRDVPHMRTFFYLEQVILKHDAAARAIRIKQVKEGVDFFFDKKSRAVNFATFVKEHAPISYANGGKKLVSQDTKSNTYNNEYTIPIEISPICREDLICLPHEVRLRLGNLGPIVLCIKVSNNIHLLDPRNLSSYSLNSDVYWKAPFKSLLSCKQLVEYIVLDKDIVPNSEVKVDGVRYVLAYVHVARISDFGKNDRIFTVKTHLGHLLNVGDYALGYDLYGANINNTDLDKYMYKGGELPEVILVKKSYEQKRLKKRGKPRSWKLKSLDMRVDHPATDRVDEEKMKSEYEQFLRDLEENPDMRLKISLYSNEEYQPSEIVDEEEDVPGVPIEELLADLELDDDDEDEDLTDDDMMTMD